MNKIIKIAEYLLFILFAVLLIFLRNVFSVLLIVPCIGLLYLLYKNNKIKNYSLFLFIIALAIRVISLFILKVEILDDFKTMYDASQSILKLDFSFINDSYFRTYPFQLGLTFYQAGLLKIWNDVFILKLFNSIYTSLIVVFLYKIMKLFVKEETARIVSFSYLLYFYPIYLNSILTNQHIPALLMLVIIYLILTKKESVWYALFIGLLLGISNFFRPESIVIILGIIIYKLVFIKKDTIKNTCLYLFSLLAIYFMFTNAFNITLNTIRNVTKTDNIEINDKSSTYWKFYCGLNVENNGMYNDQDAVTYFNSDNEKKLLIDRINQDKWKFPILFLKKEVILWTQTNFDYTFVKTYSGFWYNLFLLFNQGYLNVVLIIFVIGLFPRKEEKKEVLFIKLLIGLYYGVYFFIEVSPRYAYNLHMLVFLLLGIGLERIISWKWDIL